MTSETSPVFNATYTQAPRTIMAATGCKPRTAGRAVGRPSFLRMWSLARLGIFMAPHLMAGPCLICWISQELDVHCLYGSRRCVQQEVRAPHDAGAPAHAERDGVGLTPAHAA